MARFVGRPYDRIHSFFERPMIGGRGTATVGPLDPYRQKLLAVFKKRRHLSTFFKLFPFTSDQKKLFLRNSFQFSEQCLEFLKKFRESLLSCRPNCPHITRYCTKKHPKKIRPPRRFKKKYNSRKLLKRLINI